MRREEVCECKREEIVRTMDKNRFIEKSKLNDRSY